MRVLALGIGKMGIALLKDMTQSSDVTQIVAADLDAQKVRQYVHQMKWDDKVTVQSIDVTNRKKLVELMRGQFDAVANTLVADLQSSVAEAAIEAGVGVVDVGHIQPEVFELDKKAMEAGVTIIPSCGLDPGIDRILEGYGARKLDVVEDMYLWCGGIPQKDTPGYGNPLRYKVSWYWRRALETYLGKVAILQNGETVEVERLTGPGNPEIIAFPEPVGECEAFYTSAPFDTIKYLGLRNVKNAWNKTVRWKGHCEMWSKLIALGLTSAEPIKVKQCEVAPMDLMVELGNQRLRYEKGEGDVVLQRVHVGGQKDGRKAACVYELVDFYDKQNDVTAMGRTTAYTCSIVSQMIGRREISEKGVVHPSRIGWNTELAGKFFAELAKRGIRVTETVTQPLT